MNFGNKQHFFSAQYAKWACQHSKMLMFNFCEVYYFLVILVNSFIQSSLVNKWESNCFELFNSCEAFLFSASCT